jgi:hypothetical protein
MPNNDHQEILHVGARDEELQGPKTTPQKESHGGVGHREGVRTVMSHSNQGRLRRRASLWM